MHSQIVATGEPTNMLLAIQKSEQIPTAIRIPVLEKKNAAVVPIKLAMTGRRLTGPS